MMRLRAGNIQPRGLTPGGSSDTTRPAFRIRVYSRRWLAGYGRSAPPASTAIVTHPAWLRSGVATPSPASTPLSVAAAPPGSAPPRAAPSAPAGAAPSIPSARPLTTVTPAPASSNASDRAVTTPYEDARRAPTIATVGAAASDANCGGEPERYSAAGGARRPTSSGG